MRTARVREEVDLEAGAGEVLGEATELALGDRVPDKSGSEAVEPHRAAVADLGEFGGPAEVAGEVSTFVRLLGVNARAFR